MNDKIKAQEWIQMLGQHFEDSDVLKDYLANTLENFSYRYLASAPIKSLGQLIVLEQREENMGQALKSNKIEVKEGVKWLAKSFPKEEKPAILSRLKIEINELTAQKGKINITTEINWDFPHYLPNTEKKKTIKKTFVWDDLMKFRKEFPLALEEVCELFL